MIIIIIIIWDFGIHTDNIISARRPDQKTTLFGWRTPTKCRRHTGRSLFAMLFSWTMPSSADVSLLLENSSSSSMDKRGNPSNIWIPYKESQLNIN